ncbi:MAG: aldehyde ferredoxin oxidoreductase N-terminal domain-containing protein, partial [Desulfurococcaceae archaeon]
MGGYWGKILEIDLTTGRKHAIDVESTIFRRFIGGRGFATYYLAKNCGEVWESLDPLSPNNPLILATGVLTGYYPGVKMIVSGKSPQSHGIVGSAISSEAAIELKAAGFDALVIKGKSEKPVYLYIEDSKAEIRDAGDLWGLTGRKLLEKLAEIYRSEHDLDTPPGTLYIGPAGENQVRTSVVMSKLAHASGYGGYGAVMGSKKLKAILIKGSGPLPAVANPAVFKEIRAKYISMLKDRLLRFRQWGTSAGTWRCGNIASSTPIKNWQEEWHSVTEFSQAGFEQKVWVKNPWADYGCPVGCMKVSRATSCKGVYITDAPDYEMSAYLGSNLYVFTPEGATRLSAVADDLGLCGIQAGNVVGFVLELYQRGILTKEDIGYDVKWGDVDSIERLLYDIAYRRGIGEILSEGTYRASKKISELKGIDVSKYAVQVKGIGVGAHGIRSGRDYTGIIAYAGSVQGGDHTSVAGLPVKSTESEAWSALVDSAVICFFLDPGDQPLLDYLNAVTGWNMNLDELYAVGLRILTLQRLLLLVGGPDVKWVPKLHDE